MDSNIIEVGKTEKIISYLTPWTCYFSLYSAGIPGVHLGYVLLIVLTLIALNSHRNKIYPYSNGWLVAFYVYCIISLPFVLLLSGNCLFLQIANRVLKLFLIVFYVCYVFPSFLNTNLFIKSYRIMCFIFAFALLLQFVLYTTIGRTLAFKIPFLNYVNEWSNSTDFATQMSYTGRMTSVFLEPSHYCYFVIPIIIVCLFFESGRLIKRKYIEAAFFSITVLLSASSTGVIVTIIVWISYLVSTIVSDKSMTTKVVAFFISVIGIGIGLYLIFNNPTISFAVERLLPSYSSSNNVWSKIYGGKEIFDELPTFLKWTGNGLGNMQSVFTTGYYYTLINCGIIGTALLILWMAVSFFRTNNMGKIIILIFGMFMIVNMVLYDTNFIILAALIPIEQNKSRLRITFG